MTKYTDFVEAIVESGRRGGGDYAGRNELVPRYQGG